MRRHIAVALLGLLCVSHIALIEANVNGTAAMRARLTSRPGNGYGEDSQYAEGPKDEHYGYSEELSCPEPQPADQVKDVYLAHGVFSWRELAGVHEEQQHRGAKRATPLNRAEASSSAITRAALMSKAKMQANLQAFSGADYLLQTSTDEEDSGFQGTVDYQNFPSSEGLAVGHHPTDDDLVYVLHVINGNAEIFPVEKNGRQVEHITPTKVSLKEMAKSTGLMDEAENLQVSRVAAFFDEHNARYVIAWSTYAAEGQAVEKTPVFVASSLNPNPNGGWMVTALDLRPDVAQGVGVCHEQPPSAFHMANLQISYSKKAIFIGAAPKCVSEVNGEEVEQELSSLFVISKDALCEPPAVDEDADETETPCIYAAVYFAGRAWYRSVADPELAMVEDAYEPFNSYITPVRPQGVDDLDYQPIFVMKVSDSHLSVAALTDEDLDKMKSVETAPLLKAVVVGKGADFTNYEGNTDGNPAMPQPETEQMLYLAGMGMPQTHGGVVYWASQVNGIVYLVTGEYWGSNTTRIPSIYWAALKPTADICQLSREDQGMVASQEGLAFGYPVIAGKKDGIGALIAFSYSGADNMAGGLYKAYPGVAVTEVGGKGYSSERGIDIVKRGHGSLKFTANTGIPFSPDNKLLPWGYNSAAHMIGDDMWFAVPIPIDIPKAAADLLLGNVTTSDLWYGSWLASAECV